MTYPLTKIDGLTPAAADKLKAIGIRSTARFLEAAMNLKGRKAIAAKTGLPESQLLEWVNRADCLRVKGMGSATTGLLNAAGVTTVRELMHRNPDRLAQAMAEANARLKLARINPSAKAVGQLIERARKLPIKISY
jgi:predicted flap endonuclease-1-like 5' DNA nuclease